MSNVYVHFSQISVPARYSVVNYQLESHSLKFREVIIGGWGGVLPPHFGQKKAGDLFQISCSVCRCVGGGYLVIKVRGKLTRCVWNNKLELTELKARDASCPKGKKMGGERTIKIRI